MVTHPDPRKGPVDRTPPTGRLTVTHTERPWGVVLLFPPSGQLADVRQTAADTGRATSKRRLGPSGNGLQLQFQFDEIELDR